MDKLQKVLQLLEELSKEYENTKDPNTAEKIINLVQNEISGRDERHPSNVWHSIVKKWGIIGVVFPSLIKKDMDKSPYRVYWDLLKEQKAIDEERENERLNALYSIGSKSPTQIKVEKEAMEAQVYNAVSLSIGYLARSIILADESLQRIFESNPLLDYTEISRLRDCATFLEGTAAYIVHIGDCNRENLCGLPIDSEQKYFVEYLAKLQSSQKMADHIHGLFTERSCEVKKDFSEKLAAMGQREERVQLLKTILDERIRQITKYDYTEAHDDEHIDGSIADAAAHYASTKNIDGLWPWDPQYDKKGAKTRRDQLITSISMLLAEVERIDRQKP